MKLKVTPYSSVSIAIGEMFYSGWLGVEFLTALKKDWNHVVGIRAFYKPIYPVFLEVENEGKIISVNLGIHL